MSQPTRKGPGKPVKMRTLYGVEVGFPPRRKWRAGRYIRMSWPHFVRGLIAPFTDASATFQFVSLLGATIFAYWAGLRLPRPNAEASDWIIALPISLGIWTVLQLLLAPYRAYQADKKSGHWNGNRFIYNQRQHAFTCEWTPSRNGTELRFKFADADSQSTLDYAVEVEGPSSRVNCVVQGDAGFENPNTELTIFNFERHGRARLRKDGTLSLFCFSQPQTIPAVVRIYVLGWEVNCQVQMECTAPEARMVMTDRYADEAHSKPADQNQKV